MKFQLQNLIENLESEHIIPISVASAARVGIELYKKFDEKTVDMQAAYFKARVLSTKKAVSSQIVRDIYNYLSIHYPDRVSRDTNRKSRPTAEYVNWQLWGGDSGFAWVKKEIEGLSKNDQRAKNS